MNDFLSDLWHDLREKRLWPVAAILLVAIVAVPVVLGGADSSSGGGKGATGSPVASAAGAQVPAVAGVEDDLAGDSDLGAYDVKDPFRSGIKKPKGGGTAGVAVPIGGSAGAGGTGTATSGGSSSGSSSSGSGSGSSGSTGGSTGSSGGTAPTRPRTKLLTYVADLTFGRRGSERRRKGVRRLAMLPSSRNPLVVFLGISDDRKRAVFLLDATLSQAGEGSCRPRVRNCTFLFLRADDKNDDHFLTDQAGVEYVLKLRHIRAVRVKKRSKSKKKAKSSSHKRPRKGRPAPSFADGEQ